MKPQEARKRGSKKGSEKPARKSVPVHLVGYNPFTPPLCGATGPLLSKTDVQANVTCADCIEQYRKLFSRWPGLRRILQSEVREAKIVEVIRIVFTRGNGTSGSVLREVTQYRTPDGNPICELDPAAGGEDVKDERPAREEEP